MTAILSATADDCKPTVFLAKWNHGNRHGPGLIYSLQAAPEPGQHGDGFVPVLTPDRAWLLAFRARSLPFDDFRRRVEDRMAAGPLEPGVLRALFHDGEDWHWSPVRDGDTLCCACGTRSARNGRCHRAWAAPLLVAAGWRVVLDGRVYNAPTMVVA